MIDVLLPLGSRLAIGALFLAAASHKLSRHARFRQALQGYRIFGPAAGVLAFVTPMAEFVVGAAAFAPLPALFAPAMIGAALLLLAYAALIMTAIGSGRRHLDCGCLGFGARRPELSKAMGIRNLMLAAVALAGLLPASARPLGWPDAVHLAAALIAATLLYVAIELATALPTRSTP